MKEITANKRECRTRINANGFLSKPFAFIRVLHSRLFAFICFFLLASCSGSVTGGIPSPTAALPATATGAVATSTPAATLTLPPISPTIAATTIPTALPTATSIPPTETTAPTPTPEASIRFAVIGDYGLDGQPEADVAALVESWNPDFLITTGDNNYPAGSAATVDANIGKYYHAYIGSYTGQYGPGSETDRFFPVLGNHDWYTAGAKPYLDYFTLPGNERYYQFTQGPVDFFALDSEEPEPDGFRVNSVQAQWLQAGLAASTAPWKIVYMHEPPYSSALHGSSTWLRWPFEQWGASAVLAGHDHTYERLEEGGIPYFVNGLGGGAIYNFNEPIPGSLVRYDAARGAMLVEASPSQITFQFINIHGEVIDTYTLQK